MGRRSSVYVPNWQNGKALCVENVDGSCNGRLASKVEEDHGIKTIIAQAS